MILITNFILLSVFLLKFIGVRSSVIYTRNVTIDEGPVIGIILQTVLWSTPYNAFRGIPYAEPPVDNLRFKPPIPKKSWTDMLYASKDGNNCIQMYGKDVIGSEDCLYLNVYTPTLRKNASLPVMVWIHGGAFRTGTGNSSYYGPDFLIEQNVVVVSMNYRLGALGFININHPSVSGNNGLKDQNLALKWVQRNIHKFGGNPKKVTLVGQSAGGVSVDLHKVSPMSKGLFNNTISMSASPLCLYWPFQSNEDARTNAFNLGQKFHDKILDENHLYAILSNASAADIVRKTEDLPRTGIAFRPTLELVYHENTTGGEYFLTEHSSIVYRRGDYNKGSHMMGYTSLEILEFAKTLDDIIFYTSEAKSIIKQRLGNLFGNSSEALSYLLGSYPIPEFLLKNYDNLENLESSAFIILIKELSDLVFVTGIDKKQRLLVKNNDYPVYYYRFNYNSNFSAHRAEHITHLDGVAHEDELPYIFYRPHLNLPLREPGIVKTRRRLVNLWTNFAKYGNPTPPRLIEKTFIGTWQESGEEGWMLDISDQLVSTVRPRNVMVYLYQLLCIGEFTNRNNSCDVMEFDVIKSNVAKFIESRTGEVKRTLIDGKQIITSSIVEKEAQIIIFEKVISKITNFLRFGERTSVG